MQESKWGHYYWGVIVPKSVSQSGIIYLNADSFKIEHGVLSFSRDPAQGIDERDTEALKAYRGSWVGPTYCFAPGQWHRVFAASVLSGGACAVDNYGSAVDLDAAEPAPLDFNSKSERQKMDQKLRYKILKRDGFKCLLCGRTPQDDGVTLEVDHIDPVANGGKTVDENLRSLCKQCNRGKGISL